MSDNVYGEKTLTSYLNRAAFAQPAPGAFGNLTRNSIQGPGAWKADLAVSRLFSWANGQHVEIRIEAFNLFNTFNWGDPIVDPEFGQLRADSVDGGRSPHSAVRDQVWILGGLG